jgi:hypothetical protein
VSTAYHPSTGLLALDAPTLAAVIDHARGHPLDPAAHRGLADAGLLVADRLDPPLHAIVGPVLADGPRIRVLSRARGRLTVVDAAFAPATPDDPGTSGRATGTVVVRPPDSGVLHVRHASAGAVTRLLATTVGLGPHVLGEPPYPTPLGLRDWAVVRSGFDTATPSGWVRRRDRAALHEVRWASAPGTRAATAVVIAQLDGGLAEIRPRDTGDGAFTVAAAETTSVWQRLCALTTGAPPAGCPTTAPGEARRR